MGLTPFLNGWSYMGKKFMVDEDGQGLIEYMLIISLVAIVVIVALTFTGLTLKDYYSETVNEVTAPMGG